MTPTRFLALITAAPTASGTCCIGIRGFVWTAAGGMQVLPPLGGSTTATSHARAINHAGHIAGSAQTPAGETHALVWMAPDQEPLDLGAFGGTYSAASDLNDLGQVTGSYASGGNRSAILWSETGVVALGQLNGGDTEARGINNRGHVVGFATFDDFTQRAFLWTSENGMQDLGLPEGTIRSRATAINDAGHIAVEAEIEDGSGNVLERAFLWINGTWLDLGDLGRSGPQGINEKLQLSGFGIGPTAGMPRAIRWSVTAPQVTPRYPFEGFFAPIDNLPQVNRVRAGSAIPVKFSLGGDQGLDILADGYPLSQPIACDAGAQLDQIEETVKAGGSSLTYDPVTEQYNYIWKTDRS